MKSILTELWYGNISPSNMCRLDDAEFKNLLKIANRNREKLDDSLSEKQKEMLVLYEESMNEITSKSELEIFLCGFKLGTRIAIEVTEDLKLL